LALPGPDRPSPPDPIRAQIILAVAINGQRPALPEAREGVPAGLTALIAECWAANPRERPASGELLARRARGGGEGV
jgi:hypothetical protein